MGRPLLTRTRARAATETVAWIAVVVLVVLAHLTEPELWRWELVFVLPIGFGYVLPG